MHSILHKKGMPLHSHSARLAPRQLWDVYQSRALLMFLLSKITHNELKSPKKNQPVHENLVEAEITAIHMPPPLPSLLPLPSTGLTATQQQLTKINVAHNCSTIHVTKWTTGGRRCFSHPFIHSARPTQLDWYTVARNKGEGPLCTTM